MVLGEKSKIPAASVRAGNVCYSAVCFSGGGNRNCVKHMSETMVKDEELITVCRFLRKHSYSWDSSQRASYNYQVLPQIRYLISGSSSWIKWLRSQNNR